MDTVESMSRELEKWCEDNNLPYECAEELMLYDLDITQREYLEDFIDRWTEIH